MTLFEVAKKTSGFKTDKAIHNFFQYWKWYICYLNLDYSQLTCKAAFRNYTALPLRSMRKIMYN